MALVSCFECGRQVSDSLDACLGCGAPLSGNERMRRDLCPTCGSKEYTTETHKVIDAYHNKVICKKCGGRGSCGPASGWLGCYNYNNYII